MGWYVTCEICDESFKYRIGCDCYLTEASNNIKKSKGCVIEDSFVVNDSVNLFQIQKLRPFCQKPFYLKTCISTGSDEHMIWRKIQEIDKDEYINYKENDEKTTDTESHASETEEDELGETEEILFEEIAEEEIPTCLLSDSITHINTLHDKNSINDAEKYEALLNIPLTQCDSHLVDDGDGDCKKMIYTKKQAALMKEQLDIELDIYAAAT
jgi:hypothetical protein